MAADKMSVISFIQHYQRSILKSQEDEERLLHCLEKLHELQVLVTHLQATGVGRTVNALRKRPGPVGEAARKLVARWKQIVEAHVSSEDECVSSTRDDHEEPGSDCDTNVNQLTPSPSSEETPRKHHQTENHSNNYNNTEEDSSDEEEERKMEMNDHRHLSPPTKKHDRNSQERSSRERSNRESSSRERSNKESKSHEKSNRESTSIERNKSRETSSRERNSHERSHRESSSRERSSKRENNSVERNNRESSSRERSSNHVSKSHDKKEKSHHREHHNSHHEKSSKNVDKNSKNHDKNSKNNHEKSKSSHDRNSHENKSESHIKESSSKNHHHHSKNDDKYNNKSKDKKENSDNNKYNIKQEKSGSSLSNSSSHSKKSDRHQSTIHIKTEPSDKHISSTSSSSKNKDKKNNMKSGSSKHNIKQEPSTSFDREEKYYKTKKVKIEPEPLTFDFVVPKIKEEPLSEDSDDATDSFTDALGALDLPVPKFKKESSPAKKKIKTEPVEESTHRVRFEENGDESPVGASFEEALGFIDYPSPSKSKSKKDKKKKHSSHPSSSSSSTYSSNPDYVKPLPKSEELAAILDLPAINPNYRPLPQVPVRTQRNIAAEHDTLSAAISNKTLRTKVYSGNKSFHGEVSSLQDMCIKILQENIDALDYIGFAPFYLMEPVLSRANANQLANIERHNPILAEDTDELWEALVQSDFKGVRGAERQNGECWRDVYERSMEERQCKLGSLMAKIKMNNEARKAPQRTTKLAYVNTHVKPPRNVLKQQAKHGTAKGSLPAPRPKPVPGEDQPGPSGLSSHASTLARTVGMLRDGPSMSIKSKKRPAPLMQKTLKFMKTSFRR